MKHVYSQAELCAMTTYYVKQVYEKLTGTRPLMHWGSLVWNRLNTPRHRFIGSLAIYSRIQTTEKLTKISVRNSDACLICGHGSEDHAHLFFACQYNRPCLTLVKQWLGIHSSSYSLQ